MNLADIDWRFLRGALIWFGAALVIGGTLLWASHRFGHQAEQAYEMRKRGLVSVRSKYFALDEDKRIFDTYLPRFEGLENEGIVGPERRLQWLETLRDAAERVELPSLRYEIASQAQYNIGVPIRAGSFKVYSSEMRLNLGLLHEGDLLNLLRELDRNAKGLYTVSDCTMKRVGAILELDGQGENLSAECGLQWLTIRLPNT